MNNKYFYDNGRTFKRITRKQAITAYMNGLKIVVSAVNIRPFNMQALGYDCISRKRREQFAVDEIGVKNDFIAWLNSFEYYNCNNAECGRYAAFYIPVRTVDRFTGEEPTAHTLGTVEEYDHSFIN